MKDKLKLIGNMVIERRTKDGQTIDREEWKNLILTTGKSRVRDLIGEGIGTGVTGFSYLAIGTGTTGALVGDTSLETEVTRELATITASGDDKVIFEKTFEFGTGEEYAITEAGIGDSATPTGDTLLDRLVFTAKNVDIDTNLYVKITITVA